MSGASERLSRTIAGARDLSAVVRSMKALAISGLGQYERAVVSLQRYSLTVDQALAECLRQLGSVPAAGQSGRPGIGLILFGSDQGLVGRFNEDLLEFTVAFAKDRADEIQRVWVVGERMQQLLPDLAPRRSTLLPVPYSVAAITPLVGRLLIDVETDRQRGTLDAVHILHNRPLDTAGYGPVRRQLLPLDAAWQARIAAVHWPTPALPEAIDGPMQLVQGLLREYLFVSLFQASAESLASENASRLTAMLRAEDNIAAILQDLTQQLRRLRQASIDEDLFAVIAGYEALSCGDYVW